MSGHQARAQTVGTARHRGMDDRADEDAVVEEHLGEVHRLRLVADEHRDHARGGRHGVPALRPQTLGILLHDLVKTLDPPRLVLDDVEGGDRSSHLSRRKGCGEDERARHVPLVVDYLVRAGQIPAHRGDRLGEGAHLQVGRTGHAEVLLDAVSGLPERAGGVGLIDQQACAVLPAQLHGPRQVHDVAVHREHRVCSDHDRVVGTGGLGEQPLQVLHVVVAVGLPLGAGKQAAVHDAGMVEFVHEEQVAGAHEPCDDGDVGDVPARVDACVLAPGELGYASLETLVDVGRAGEKTHSPGTGTVLLDGLLCCFVDAWMADEPEVGIGREHHHLATVHHRHTVVDIARGRL